MHNRNVEKKHLSEKQYRLLWKRFTAVLSVFVIVGTLGSLMLPAITMNKDQCQIPEHTHTPECYSGEMVRQLSCSTQVHSHSEACYQGETLTCGEADFVLHTHEDGCYDASGALVCALPEIQEHQHDETCWEILPGHTHGDACYVLTQGDTPVCGQEESASVQEGELGYFADMHTHSEACYEKVRGDLTCTQAEVSAQTNLICQKVEAIVHTHVYTCYETPEQQPAGDGAQLASFTDMVAAEEANKVLVCTQPILQTHQHGEGCFVEKPALTCGLSEHTHISTCFPEKALETETPEEWEALLPQTLTGDWAQDLVLVARSQLGYTESQENLGQDAQGQIRGYTRYGQWAGIPYADWQIPFLSFCLHYAGIPETAIPGGSELSSWRETLTEAGLLQAVNAQYPRLGDLVFLDRDGDGAAEAAGILTEAEAESGEVQLVTLEVSGGAVAQVNYDVNELLDYVSLSEARLRHDRENPHTLTHRGEDYTLTVSYGPGAMLPEGVTLSVRELLSGDAEYDAYMERLKQSVPKDELVAARLFDVTLLSAQGEKLEPAQAVDIAVVYDEPMQIAGDEMTAVYHFKDEETAEHLDVTHVTQSEDVMGVQFSQDSFSVSAVVTMKNPAEVTSSEFSTSMPRLNVPSTAQINMEDGNADNGGIDPARRVADEVTLDSWESRYDRTNISTQFAGGVYVDKSVTTGRVTYSNDGISGEVKPSDQDSFLVGLSTMASTMSVWGKESAPTDVMFILDMSSSMYNYGDPQPNPTQVQNMVDALNRSMENLLEYLNPNNRVGVTIYFGGGYADLNSQSTKAHGKVLMPLDRYTKGTDGTYLKTVLDGRELHKISVSSGVTAAKTNTAFIAEYDIYSNDHPNATAGTYAQLGILHAMKEFLDADTFVLEADGVTKTPRRPVFVFMSDGRPTAVSKKYTQAHEISESADFGSNREKARNAAEADFLTQLTASYAKLMVQRHYKESTDENKLPLFYTLGLGNGVSEDVMNPEFANTTGVNNVDHGGSSINITNRIKDYWTTLANNGNVEFNVYRYGAINTAKTIKVEKVTIQAYNGYTEVNFPESADQINYVDSYYIAATSAELANAFNNIVLDISIQQEFTPTFVTGNRNLSGDVSFVDQIGQYMTVTKVRGIIHHGHLYTGSELAKNYSGNSADNKLGTMDQPTELGNLFAMTVANDLGLNGYTEVNPVIDVAYQSGQLYYNSETDFSNYITWYADENNNFITNVHEGEPGSCTPGVDGDTCNHTSATRPANAKYVIRSYFYLGTPISQNTEGKDDFVDTNLVVSAVWVRKDLSTQTETVVFSMPSSVLPTVDYDVGLGQNDELIRLNVSGAATPSMLLYEVSLDPQYNIAQLVDGFKADIEDGKTTYDGYDPKTGTVKFYTNEWERDHKTGYGTSNTYAYFRAGTENTRYYFTEDTQIYYPDGRVATADGVNPASEEGYNNAWYAETTIYKKSQDGTLTKEAYKRLLSDDAIKAAIIKDGKYIIPKGTPQGITFFGLSQYNDIKNGTINTVNILGNNDQVITDAAGNPITREVPGGDNGKTGTLLYSDYPYVQTVTLPDDTTTTTTTTLIGATLGNNGYLLVSPGEIAGVKTMEGMDLNENAYTFELYKTDSTFAVAENATPLRSTTNAAGQGAPSQGAFTFASLYPAGMSNPDYYVIKEKIPTDTQGIFYDGTEYRLTVKVDADGNTVIENLVHVYLDGTQEDITNDNTKRLEFVNKTGVLLPETGGSGTFLYMFSGLTILLAGLLMYSIQRKKKRGAV